LVSYLRIFYAKILPDRWGIAGEGFLVPDTRGPCLGSLRGKAPTGIDKFTAKAKKTQTEEGRRNQKKRSSASGGGPSVAGIFYANPAVASGQEVIRAKERFLKSSI
jgi:hypothetical protein